MLYHKDVYLPKIGFAPNAFALDYSNHAQRAALDDRYGNLTAYLPASYVPKFEDVVEVEVEGRRVVKSVFRFNVSADLDLCLVVRPVSANTWKVVTVWANKSNDLHRSLDRSKYAQAA